ncbi:uncharacterized protein LOC108202509 isoform X1 [Daucus carota subsp. sativus]|uniref:uncharacterized protein LOC108202509 isoform X1 n=1 Tax=Daucus carota subsp. sativus TaxID=79200 RepID=UPI0007EF492E|nr:PREDICTED: uncharacterized protein LOC108202509 isoform X1 [Daucus carota subsp. sativus]
MDYQQPHHSYARPPPTLPPPPSDPNHHQQQPPSLAPPPPGPSWYSGQFQYAAQANQNHQQWAPPYPAPPPQPYAAHHQYQPPPPPPPPRPQAYPPQLNQEWHNSGWNQHQNQQLQYPAHNNGEDWAAKARAWAAAQNSSDNQYPQSQYTSFSRKEENQYSVPNPQYADGQHFPVAASSYQQYQASVAPPYQSSESSFSSGYVQDGHMPFNGRNGSLVGGTNSALPHQESSPSNASVHLQEVPSSYSSFTGKEDITNQSEQFSKSPWAFTSTSQQQAQPAADGRALPMEQPQYAFSHQSAGPPSDLSDQPLDFNPSYNRDHNQHVQSNYSRNAGVPLRDLESPSDVASIHAWSASAAPGVVYPPVHPPGPQVDPSLSISSPVSGNFGPLFGRISGQNFQPLGQSVSMPFGGTGTFSGDGFGASGVSDRTKKPSVPNWLREEIIKKKAVIATSAPDFSEDPNSVAEDVIDKSFVKGDPDSRSIDSSRSTEEEDDEEDDGEIARTAAINQEIKRVLTEILLKVTDELFNEIATKVLSEEVDHNNASVTRDVSPSAPEIPTPKASAKVLITARTSGTESDDTKKLTSAPGDLLGLASYASDDDEDDESQNVGVPNSKRNTIDQPSTNKMLSNEYSAAEAKENMNKNFVSGSDGRMFPNGSSGKYRPDNELNNNGPSRESSHGFSPDDAVDVENKADIATSTDNIKGQAKTELSIENFGSKKVTSGDTEVREDRKKTDDKRRSSAGKYIDKEPGGDGAHARGDESHRRQEERKVKKEKKNDYDESKEKSKEQGLKSVEKYMDPNSKRRSSHRNDKDMKQTDKDRSRSKEASERKRDGTRDEEGERSRDKLTSDSRRHKRHRSPSVGSKGRDDKNHTVVGHTKNSSDDESSGDSRRKSRTRKRKSSPSPDRSRRRQVSRSPHSKHSQRRHSPYSSLETTRYVVVRLLCLACVMFLTRPSL